MKKRIFVTGIIAASLTLLCIGAFVFLKNYKPLIVKKEVPYYDEKIIAEVRLDSVFMGEAYELSVYRTTNLGFFHSRRTLLEKELKFGPHNGTLDKNCVELGGEGSQVIIKICHNGRIWTESCRLK